MGIQSIHQENLVSSDLTEMIISSIRLRNIPEDSSDKFPWTLPLIQQFESIDLTQPITFFVGENGSGKSTVLEALAAATEVPIAGSLRLENDASLTAANELGNYLSLRYTDKSRHGFFVRAEDFIGFARKIKNDIAELNKEAEELQANWTGGDIKLALGAITGEKDSLVKRYGQDLEALSHGESFIKFFKSRITGKGLYLIDEPEAALSPNRQLELMALMLEKSKIGCQFIVATHSPIIMSCPQSNLYLFKNDSITEATLHDTDHYRITKAILDNPDHYLKELL